MKGFVAPMISPEMVMVSPGLGAMMAWEMAIAPSGAVGRKILVRAFSSAGGSVWIAGFAFLQLERRLVMARRARAPRRSSLLVFIGLLLC